MAFPPSILVLFEVIEKYKGAEVCFNNGKGEVEVHAPDPGEVNEAEEQKIFGLFKKLEIELKGNDFKIKVFERGEGIDAIRIYLTRLPEETAMKADKIGANVLEKEQEEFTCQVCGKKIEKVLCKTHEEPYERGHKEDCIYNQKIKQGCTIDEN